MNLLDSFQRYIDENDLATHDDRILLTVSGGVDSMVMLSLFTRCGYRVGVAHCNFQLRGAESDEDEVLVEDEAKKHGAAFYNRRFETRAEMERTGESMEMAARRLRYAGFDALSREHGYTAIAIAHHADDSIETFFINLLRGTGLRGLTDGSKDPLKVEQQLRACIPPEESSNFCHRMVLHGRALCMARKPDCGDCSLRPLCDHGSGK